MNESDIVARLRNGDDEAFREVVEKYQVLVLNCAYRFLRNKESAEDLTQEVFMEVFESVHAFRAESRLSTWIYRIAVTKSLNKLKALKRKKRFAVLVSVADEGGLADRLPDSDSASPEQEMENRERREVLDWALEKLPDNQRIAFTLSKVEEMSYEEIAGVMNASIPAVESLIHRAKENLRKKLYGYYKSHLS
jgi:RNA polymerase sigma-70 factor, ECF subfamily